MTISGIGYLSILIIILGYSGKFYWAKRTGYLHDTWYHLLASEKIRTNNHRLPERIEHFIFEGPYDYPPFLHWALSYFPEDWVKRNNWIVSPIIDSVHGVGLLLPFAYLVTNRLDAALIAVAIYAITPELFRHYTGLTPRVLGALLFSVVLISTILAIDGYVVLFVSAVGVGAVILMTHKMSSQSLAFVLLGFAILQRDPTYVLVLIGIILAALVLSRGHYVKVLRSHFAIINFWRIQRSKGNPPDAFSRDLGAASEPNNQSLLDFARVIVTHINPIWVFVSNPWTIFLPVPLFLYGGVQLLSPLEMEIASWALMILVIALATQYIPPLKLVGEGWKYFLWGTFPAALILGRTIVDLQATSLYIAMAGLGAISIGFIYFMMQSRVRSEHTSDIAGAFEIVTRLRNSDLERIMCIPPMASYPLAYLTRKRVLWHDSTTAYMDGEIYYPTPQVPLEEIATRFDIDAVVIDKSKVAVNHTDFETYGPEIEDSDFLLLERVQ